MATSIQQKSNTTRGYAIALLSAAILSTTGILIRYLTQTYQMPSMILAFWRDVFVFLTLLLILTLMKPKLTKVKPQHMRYLLGYGFVLAIFNALWTLSVALNGAAVSTVLVYSSAGFTALLGWRLLDESLGWPKLLAIVISLGGCVLVSEALNPEVLQFNSVGILTGILSGLGFAVYTLMGRSASQRGLNPWTTLLYTFAFAALFLLIFNLLPGSDILENASQPVDLLWLGGAMGGWLILFILAAGPTLAGFGLYNVSLGYLPSSIVNLIVTLEPVFTALIAYFLLNERLIPIQLFGSSLILVGVVFLRITEK